MNTPSQTLGSTSSHSVTAKFPPLDTSLWSIFALSYLAIVINLSFFSFEIRWTGALTPLFAAIVFISYPLVYLFPVQMSLILAEKALQFLASRIGSARLLQVGGFALLGLSTLYFTAVHLILFSDRFVYHLYSFHLNGFVWNLITTPGGIDSMGAGTSTQFTVALLVLGFVILQLCLLWVALRGARARTFLSRWFSGGTRWKVIGTLALLLAIQGISYGLSSLRNYSPILTAASTVPFYVPFTFRKLGRSLGLRAEESPEVHLKLQNSVRINYPLKPLQIEPGAKQYNILWLACESWRYDMLNPEVMPETYAFAQKAQWFRNHYSGGNGTRMGMFSMFYGLYGNYWFPFLAEHRGPVLMDHIIDHEYQLDLHTSAEFTYPEFDKTLFARVPRGKMKTIRTGMGWEKDRHHVGQIIEFIQNRDPSKPFFAFEFFESPHAPYHFPDEAVIRTDYLQDFNYATANLQREMPRIHNRYINSCRHLDQQIARLLACLQESALMESTIIVLTGDHGEEFMEKGHWGHGGQFVEEQIRPPLVLWLPGRAPAEHTFLSSHLDIAPTVLSALGVTNPPEDYSLGYDLMKSERREFSVLADWNRICFMDKEYKAVLPTNSWEMTENEVTTRQDAPVENPNLFFTSRRSTLNLLMKQMTRFGK